DGQCRRHPRARYPCPGGGRRPRCPRAPGRQRRLRLLRSAGRSRRHRADPHQRQRLSPDPAGMNASPSTRPGTRLSIAPPDDWHLHLRDGDALRAVVAASAAGFGRAIVMPNLRPAVTTVAQALAYRERIDAALADALAHGELGADAAASFRPLMTLYLTDR